MSKFNRDALLEALVFVTSAMQKVPLESKELYMLERIYTYLERQLELESFEG